MTEVTELTDGSEEEYEDDGPYDETSVPVMDCVVVERDTQEQKDDHLCNITGDKGRVEVTAIGTILGRRIFLKEKFSVGRLNLWQ